MCNPSTSLDRPPWKAQGFKGVPALWALTLRTPGKGHTLRTLGKGRTLRSPGKGRTLRTLGKGRTMTTFGKGPTMRRLGKGHTLMSLGRALGGSLVSTVAGRCTLRALGPARLGWVALLPVWFGPCPTHPPQSTVSNVHTLHPHLAPTPCTHTLHPHLAPHTLHLYLAPTPCTHILHSLFPAHCCSWLG